MSETIFYSDVATSGWPVSWTIGAFLIGFLVFFLLIIFIVWLKRRLSRPELHGLTREQAQKRWKNIMQTSSQSGEMGLKLALVEADTLLDAGLKSLIMPGDTLGERLKAACYKYPKLKNVWWAHKLRNNLVHDHSFQLRSSEAKRALSAFEAALKELKVL